jgi:hypothetical protein
MCFFHTINCIRFFLVTDSVQTAGFSNRAQWRLNTTHQKLDGSISPQLQLIKWNSKQKQVNQTNWTVLSLSILCVIVLSVRNLCHKIWVWIIVSHLQKILESLKWNEVCEWVKNKWSLSCWLMRESEKRATWPHLHVVWPELCLSIWGKG